MSLHDADDAGRTPADVQPRTLPSVAEAKSGPALTATDAMQLAVEELQEQCSDDQSMIALHEAAQHAFARAREQDEKRFERQQDARHWRESLPREIVAEMLGGRA